MVPGVHPVATPLVIGGGVYEARRLVPPQNVGSGRTLWSQNTPKIYFGRGSAPDFTGGAYSAPPDPLAGGEGISWPSRRTLPRLGP